VQRSRPFLRVLSDFIYEGERTGMLDNHKSSLRQLSNQSTWHLDGDNAFDTAYKVSLLKSLAFSLVCSSLLYHVMSRRLGVGSDVSWRPRVVPREPKIEFRRCGKATSS
jgi:hypothetical protein